MTTTPGSNDPTQQIPTAGTQPVPQTPPPPPPAAPGYAPPPPQGPAGGGPQGPIGGDPQGPQSGGSGRSKAPIVIAAVAASLLVVGVGGAFAVSKLKSSGEQPDTVLPGDAILYGRLDIDPSAGQKIGAVRFLNKLPGGSDNFQGDYRAKLFDQVKKSSTCMSSHSFGDDVEPWLGDRAAIAMRPGGDAKSPNMVAAVAVKDEGKSKAWFEKVEKDCGKAADLEVNYKQGYALLTPKGKGSDTLAAIDKGNLAANANYKDDMAAIGEQGVASLWMDMGEFAKAVPNAQPSKGALGALAKPEVVGRVAMAVRFNPDFVELAGVTRGDKVGYKPGDTGASNLTRLPDDTFAALHLTGLNEAITQNWPRAKEMLEKQFGSVSSLESQFGIKLPDDVALLLGKQFTLAAPPIQVKSKQVPQVGAKVTTTDGAKAKAVLDKLLASGGSQASEAIKVTQDGDTLSVASTSEYADKLARGGNLGDKDTFKLAVADADKANAALYVDLDSVESQYLESMTGDQRQFAEALRAIGFSASVTGDGESKFALRVVGN